MVSVEIEALDRSRLLRDVADVLSEHHVNILSCTSQTQADRIARLRFEFELADPGHLDSILAGGEAGRFGLRSDPRAARRPDLSQARRLAAQISGRSRPTRFRTGAGTPTSTACSGQRGRELARAEPGSLAIERGDGFDADAGFTIVEVVVAATLLLVAFVAAAGLFEQGTRVSGDTRQRVVAAQLASAAIEKVRGPAADPAAFTTAGRRPARRSRPRRVNGLQFTVTQDMQWVGQTVDDQRVRQRRRRQQRRSCRCPSRSPGRAWAGPRRCSRSTALVAAGRCVLRGDRFDRGEGARRDRAPGRRARSVSITGPDRPDAERRPPRAARSSRSSRRARTR